MKADKGMTCGFEENIRGVLTDAERKLIVDPKEKPMPAKNIQKAKFLSLYLGSIEMRKQELIV